MLVYSMLISPAPWSTITCVLYSVISALPKKKEKNLHVKTIQQRIGVEGF